MIRVQNISKTYNNIPAVDNISFKLNQGDIVGFLGVNGAGKSTTMKIITGVIAPDNGVVNIFGYDVEKQPIEAKRQIGYLSEDNPMPGEMYVREFLEFVVGIYNLQNKKDLVENTIEKFGLKNEYRKKISALSKGNRQKLGLAQAMMHDPKFLILDEAASGLDPNQREVLNNLITEESKDKIILLSTHILQDVENICNRTIIINRGKILLDKQNVDRNEIENVFHNIEVTF